MLDEEIRAIPGVVTSGLFMGIADVVLIQTGETVDTRRRPLCRVCDAEAGPVLALHDQSPHSA